MKSKEAFSIFVSLLVLSLIAVGVTKILASSNEKIIKGSYVVNSITTQDNIRINEVDFYLYKSKYQSILRGQATYLNHGKNYILKNNFMGSTTILKVNGENLSTPMEPEPLKDVNINSPQAINRISKDYMIAANPLNSLKGKNFKKFDEHTYLYEGKCLKQITACVKEKTVIKFNSKFLPLTITRRIYLENGIDYFTTSFDYGNFTI